MSECVVFGKGDKERYILMLGRRFICKTNIDSRMDDNPALFVTCVRMRESRSAAESRLRNGKTAGYSQSSSACSGRTLHNDGTDKGMPIEQLQKLLGHKRIDTTLQYAMVKQSNVKLAHKKYIG